MSVGKKYHKLVFFALEDEILIEKVKENPPLYAKKLKSYKDMKMKDSIWTKIAKEMVESGYNRTGEDCRKRWSNLRDYYVRKKKVNSTGSAASSQGNENFDHMKFLDTTALLHRNTKSNVSADAIDGEVNDDENGPVGDGSDVESQKQETGNQSTIEETTVEEITIEENEQIDETQENEPTSIQESEEGKADAAVQIEKIANAKRITESETQGRKDTKRARTQLLQDIQKGRSERTTLLRNIAQRAITSMPQPIEDPVDLFFKSLAATAKTLSPWYLAEAKRKLFLVMAEIEEKDIEEKYRDQYRPSLFTPTPKASPMSVLTSTPSPSLSLPSCSDNLSSAFHAIGQDEYFTHEHTRPSCSNTNREPIISSDCTIQNYIATYPPL